MLAYMERTEQTGDLPLYDKPTYERTIEAGRFAARCPDLLTANASWKTVHLDSAR